MRAVCRYFLVLCLAAAWVGPVAAADPLEEFKEAKRELLHLYRSKQSTDRVQAIQQLSKYPIEDSVRLIYSALDDPAPEVSQLAYHSLEEMNGNLEVCETLLRWPGGRPTPKTGEPGPLPRQSRSCCRPSCTARSRTSKRYWTKASKSKNGAPLVILLVDELAARHDASAVVPLERLSKHAAFDASFGVRRSIVNALTRIPTKEAVGALISIMDRVGGEARADAVEYLVPLTHQIFGMESAAWQRWWEESKDTFAYPATTVRAPYRSTLTESESGYYYGMPLFAERLVFVLDTSGSMGGPTDRRPPSASWCGRSTACRTTPSSALSCSTAKCASGSGKLVPANEQNKRAAMAIRRRSGSRLDDRLVRRAGDGVRVRHRGDLFSLRRCADLGQVSSRRSTSSRPYGRTISSPDQRVHDRHRRRFSRQPARRISQDAGRAEPRHVSPRGQLASGPSDGRYRTRLAAQWLWLARCRQSTIIGSEPCTPREPRRRLPAPNSFPCFTPAERLP